MKLSDRLIFLAFLSLSWMAEMNLLENNPSLEYIDTYKDIAISEMDRTGIPASIKLAQGLVESGAGKSSLSREANNHFGIKCGGSWTGKTYKLKDDDYVNGKLIKSCFRSFDNAYASYIAHSDFLTTQRRYATLFDFSKQDYYSWAKGLKKAGYATDPAYADKLINIIEKYQLFQYDDVSAEILVDNKNTGHSTSKKPKESTEVIIASADNSQKSRDTRTTSSKRKSNSPSTRSRKNSKKESHRVREGETIASIANSYELDPTIVRLRNRIPKDAEPIPGEKIHLRKKFSVFKRPKFTRTVNQDVAVQEEYIF